MQKISDRSINDNREAKIFVIGFNKCGTTSFHRLFTESGINSVHWKTPEQEFIAPRIFANLCAGVDILAGLSHFRAFSDLFFLEGGVYLEANGLFREFHRQYPNALFILNTRDRDRWISSRLNHANAAAGSFGSRMQRLLGMDEQQVIDVWSRQWDQHHQAVRAYFHLNPNFFEFNIEDHEPAALVDFLGGKGVAVDLDNWRRHNMTNQKRSAGRLPGA